MSKIHDIPGGYWTKTGKHRERKMLTMTAEERAKLYDYCCTIQKLKAEIKVPDWNKHDKDVIPGVANNVGPIHRGGRNRDITTDQLQKLVLALTKMRGPCKVQTGHNLPTCNATNPTNLDNEGNITELTSADVKKQMDAQRASDKIQKHLKDNPAGRTDDYTNFNDLWPDYKTSNGII